MPQRVNIKYCRHCGRIIPLDSVECPYCRKTVIRGTEQKECPFCGELIKAKAIKCKHCGEFLDGRSASGPGVPQQIVQIENAIITAGGAPGEVELCRPDGEPIVVSALGALEAPERKALPAGEQEQAEQARLPVKAEAVEAEPLPAEPVPVEPVPMPDEEPVAEAAPPVPAATGEAPPVEMNCSSCGHMVWHGDHYCENCGRDLTKPRGERTLRTVTVPYHLTDYALLLSAAAPAGLLLPGPFDWVIAAAGIVLGIWCLVRIRDSKGVLEGKGMAVKALLLGAFWLILILIARGT